MNRKLAATAVILLLLPAAIAVLLLLLPAATAVLLTKLTACLLAFLPACLGPACLSASLLDLSRSMIRTAENTVQQDQPELASKTKVCVCWGGGRYSDFWLLQGLGLLAGGGGRGSTLPCLQELGLFFFFFSLQFKISPRESQTSRTYMSFIGVPSVARNVYS